MHCYKCNLTCRKLKGLFTLYNIVFISLLDHNQKSVGTPVNI